MLPIQSSTRSIEEKRPIAARPVHKSEIIRKAQYELVLASRVLRTSTSTTRSLDL